MRSLTIGWAIQTSRQFSSAVYPIPRPPLSKKSTMERLEDHNIPSTSEQFPLPASDALPLEQTPADPAVNSTTAASISPISSAITHVEPSTDPESQYSDDGVMDNNISCSSQGTAKASRPKPVWRQWLTELLLSACSLASFIGMLHFLPAYLTCSSSG